ncbi:Peptidoglycan/LPS O-acetylase OafA/YrhL, contains acyltransferase and SGNH-hydrolase domains [Shimia marina]|uniref:O-acetyltransferase OatA n=2 Tax=Shimia marina TaxID=321267 RepID=A0A0P1F7Z5_9RHOB|nr:O-acetyltransferase OatA [Shimia marina]SFD57427.1 Peptidoglycan/LPS O-acetylase OafA/YrhL, contains acyltransferase and SGNH-hydrolase domains [Shimia marina]
MQRQNDARISTRMTRALPEDDPETADVTPPEASGMASDGMTPGGTAHRAEIDGLRAIAVLAVVFYHFGVPGFGGGFVGVDIFFVISGFLIGGILWREHQATGRLALGAFYMRRIRRLAPAYFVMAFAVLAIGSLILLPSDFRETAKGVIAATVYLSNILFFRQAGYFDGAAEEKIMLHSWSLSVEEQFYIFLPLVFLLFARNRTVLMAALGGCFALSLISSVVMTFQAHTAAFYLFPFRAWELLAGVGLAILTIEKPDLWRPHQALSWAGLALVLASVVLVQPGAAFPGLQVILPVLGTVLLIGNGTQNNLVNSALSQRVPVLIGLMSYSLYLWHWPVFTLTTYLQERYAGPAETALWIAISFVLAGLSWRFVEQPVRRATGLSNWALLAAVVAASASALMLSWAVYKTDGLPQRFDRQAQVHIAATGDFIQDFSRCAVADTGPFAGLELCRIGPDYGAPNLLIWGDSHVRAYFEGLDQAAHEANRAGLVIWRAGCAPLFDIRKQESAATRAQDAACGAANAQIRQALAMSPDLRDVLLIGRWSYYASGKGVGSDAHNSIRLSSERFGVMTQDALLAKALQATVTEIALQDRAVYVLRQPPEIAHYNAPKVARALAHGRLSEQLARRIGQITVTDATRRAAGGEMALARSGARILDSWRWFCDPFLCDAVQNGVGQFFDNNHVTNAAARRMREVFYPAMLRQVP